MLIGITGSICSGKHTTAEYLVQHHGFLRLHLPTPSQLQPVVVNNDTTTSDESESKSKSKSNGTVPGGQQPQPQPQLAHLLPSVTDQKGTRGLTFPDVDSLLEFVTKRWREHWVLTDIYDESTLELLLRRPFFLLLNVEAPVGVRYQRFSERCRHRSLAPLPLSDFISYNDLQLYGTRCLPAAPPSTSTTSSPRSSSSSTTPTLFTSGILHLTSRSHLHLVNIHPSISAYYTFLSTLDLASPVRLRPTWDAYFMTLAHLASQRSNCMKRRVGCVLVHNSRILSTGYNGTPRNLRNCNEGGCARCNSAIATSSLSTCLCLHAEENALLEAGRERIREGCILYCDTCPCLTCSVKIAQVGVKEVVYSQSYNMDEASRQVLKEAGVGLRQFIPPKSGLVGFGFDPDADTTSTGQDGEGEGQELVVRNGIS
ncbi:Deoxycytidine monophosphate (dCMP) deaminase [Exophiala xenobiotica]|nr:Deoxycytidine monophosphate (dCMP) deaminase [Exophiala xenobiotica]KAK5347925.1 Deoxycytidine monophosphate (dCMP) deaminase [Exophiala xenobiotica]KAK5371643.1 Deoxycytidine monophosphate (dCMP) deaminase [Exophiala xenobiotica]